MSNTCQWCRKPRATEADHGNDDTDPKSHLCWREWNDYSECQEIERGLCEIAPLMRDALLARGKLLEPTPPCSNEAEFFAVYITQDSLVKKAIAAINDIQ